LKRNDKKAIVEAILCVASSIFLLQLIFTRTPDWNSIVLLAVLIVATAVLIVLTLRVRYWGKVAYELFERTGYAIASVFGYCKPDTDFRRHTSPDPKDHHVES